MARPLSGLLCFNVACMLSLAACGMAETSQDAPSIYKTEAAAQPLKPADTAWAAPSAKTGPEQKAAAAALAAAAVPAPPVPATAPAASEAATMSAVNQRIDGLEKQVAEMRNDMSMMMPALTKLVNAQQDLQQVLNRLDTSSGSASGPIGDTDADKAAQPGMPGPSVPVAAASPASPPVQAAEAAPQPLITNNAQATAAGTLAAADVMPSDAPLPHDAVPAPMPPVPPGASAAATAAMEMPGALPASPVTPTAQAAAFSVSEIRFGEHANMTRIVLDASGKVPYTYSLDTTGTLMTIMLPQTAWKTTAQFSPPGSLVESYTATPDGQGGSIVALRLKKPVTISWSDILAPGPEGGYRVVMDMSPKA
jgi:hypothetical protein